MLKSPAYYLHEARYQARRGVIWSGGALAQTAVKFAMGGGAASMASTLAPALRDTLSISQPAGQTVAVSAGQALLSGTGGLITVGVSSAINFFLHQMEYRKQERDLLELYRPQVASITGIEAKSVQVDDLYGVASTNPTLFDELTRYRHSRNLKNVAGVVSTVAAFGAVFLAIAFVPALATLGVAAVGTGLLSLAGVGFAVVAGAISLGAMHVARKAVMKIGAKLFGMDKPTVEDKIHELGKSRHKEKEVSQEQVLDIYVSAKPDLAAQIEEEFGKSWEKLDAREKADAASLFGEQIDLAGIAQDISKDRINVRELTFRIHGQESGVYPGPSLRARLIDAAQDKVQDLSEQLAPVQQRLDAFGHDAVDKFQDWREAHHQSKLQDKVAKAIDEGRDLPEEAQGQKQSWRERILERAAQHSLTSRS